MKIETLLKELSRPQFWKKQCERFFFFQKFVIGNRDTNLNLHLKLCDFVQEPPPWIRERYRKKNKARRVEKLILVPRGHLKTSVVTKGYPVFKIKQWDFSRRPLRILIANARFDNAIEFMRDILSQIENNKLLHALWPNIFNSANLKKATWKEKYIRVPVGNHYFSIHAASYHQGLASLHFDLMIFDDLINEENFTSEAEMNKVKTWFAHTYSLGENDSEIIVIGTRYSYSDLYEMILTDDAYSTFKVFKKACWEKDRNGDFIRDEKGQLIPIFPEKYTNADLFDIKKKQGIFFSYQYLNEPIAAEVTTVKDEWIQYYETLPPGKYNIFLASDPARTDKPKADYSAIIVGALNSEGQMYILEAIQGRWSTTNYVENLFKYVKIYNPLVVGVETENFEMIERVIREYSTRENIWIPFQKLKSGGRNKIQRIVYTIQPWFEAKRVFIKPSHEELRLQLLQFSPVTPPKHDDLIDTLAYLLQIAYPPKRQEAVSEGRNEWLKKLIEQKRKAHNNKVLYDNILRDDKFFWF